jgi:hypothetical protein
MVTPPGDPAARKLWALINRFGERNRSLTLAAQSELSHANRSGSCFHLGGARTRRVKNSE